MHTKQSEKDNIGKILKQLPYFTNPPFLLEKSEPPFFGKFQKMKPIPFTKGVWGDGGSNCDKTNSVKIKD